MTQHVLIQKNLFGRWVVVNAVDPQFAWSGSYWVPHLHGIPTGGVQVSNFDSSAEACVYAEQKFGFQIDEIEGVGKR
jgi:hypothetical protein